MTKVDQLTAQLPATHAAGMSIRSLSARIIEPLRRLVEASRSRRQLESLSEHLLEDIGPARKHFPYLKTQDSSSLLLELEIRRLKR